MNDAPPSIADPFIGMRVNSYVVERRLGAGGMGAVYLGVQPEIGKKVAIKFLAEEFNANSGLVQRFFQEARAVNVVGHENIVDIFDFGRTVDGYHFLVMELLEGPTLERLLADEKALSMARVVDIARQMASALTAAHERGIVHRDIKPDNIFLVRRAGHDDFVKVLDFGIAKLTGDEGMVTGRSQQRTQNGIILGTPGYMAPEQAGGGTVDHRADIYAVGVMIYRMLAGRLPFDGASLAEIFRRQLMEEAESLLHLRADVPKALDDLVRWMLQRDVTARPSAMREVQASLERVAQGEPLRTSVVWYVGPPSDRGSRKSIPGVPLTEADLDDLAEPVLLTQRRSGRGLLAVGLGMVVVATVGLAVMTRRSLEHEPGTGLGEGALVAAPAAVEAVPAPSPSVPTPQPRPNTVARAPLPVEAAAPRPREVLRVESEPAGAEVLDERRRSLGRTPLELPVGAAVLGLRLPGYSDERLEILPGQTSAHLMLRRAAAKAEPARPGRGPEPERKPHGISLDD